MSNSDVVAENKTKSAAPRAALLSTLLQHQFARFMVVGLLNSAFGYGCFYLLLHFGLHYALAVLLSTVLGTLFNFKSTGTLVFKARNNRLIFRFIAVYGLLYLVNVSGIKLLISLALSPQVGGALMLLPMAALAFFLNKRYVFRHD